MYTRDVDKICKMETLEMHNRCIREMQKTCINIAFHMHIRNKIDFHMRDVRDASCHPVDALETMHGRMRDRRTGVRTRDGRCRLKDKCQCGTKEMKTTLSNLPAGHLFGCAAGMHGTAQGVSASAAPKDSLWVPH